MSAERPPKRRPGDVERDETSKEITYRVTVATRIANLLRPTIKSGFKSSTADAEKYLVDRPSDPHSDAEISEQDLHALRKEAEADWSSPEAQVWLEESRRRAKAEPASQTDFSRLDVIIKSHF